MDVSIWTQRLRELGERGGAPRKYEDAEELVNAINDYFVWYADNPLQSTKLVSSGGASQLMDVPHARMVTVFSLVSFLGIGEQTWRDWEKNEKFSGIVKATNTIMKGQKLEGAAVGMFNANLVARLTSLAEKVESNVEAKIETTDLDVSKLSTRTLKELQKLGIVDEPDLDE